MKAHYKTADGRIVFEVTAETAKAVFEAIASVQELFEAETACGVCHSKEGKGIRYRVRHAEKDGRQFKYYELLCLECFARFQFGQASEGGGLFPKRKDKDGNRLEHRGWSKFERKQQTAGSVPQPISAGTSRRDNSDYEYTAGITDDDVPF